MDHKDTGFKGKKVSKARYVTQHYLFKLVTHNNTHHVRTHKSDKIHIKHIRMDVQGGMSIKGNKYMNTKRALHRPVLIMDHELRCMVNSTFYILG